MYMLKYCYCLRFCTTLWEARFVNYSYWSTKYFDFARFWCTVSNVFLKMESNIPTCLSKWPICIHQYESNITSCLPVYTEIFFRVFFSSRANKAFTVKLIHLFLLFPNSQIRCMEGASFIYNHTLSRKKSVTITFFMLNIYLQCIFFVHK